MSSNGVALDIGNRATRCERSINAAITGDVSCAGYSVGSREAWQSNTITDCIGRAPSKSVGEPYYVSVNGISGANADEDTVVGIARRINAVCRLKQSVVCNRPGGVT